MEVTTRDVIRACAAALAPDRLDGRHYLQDQLCDYLATLGRVIYREAGLEPGSSIPRELVLGDVALKKWKMIRFFLYKNGLSE